MSQDPAAAADFAARLAEAKRAGPEIFAIAAEIRQQALEAELRWRPGDHAEAERRAAAAVKIVCVHDAAGALLIGRCTGDHSPIPDLPAEADRPKPPPQPYRGRGR